MHKSVPIIWLFLSLQLLFSKHPVESHDYWDLSQKVNEISGKAEGQKHDPHSNLTQREMQRIECRPVHESCGPLRIESH